MAVVALLLLSLLYPSSLAADIESFRVSKELMKERVYHDRADSPEGSYYCGCSWSWAGASGGKIDHTSCSYEVRKQQNRASRLEWEHIVPAWVMGH